MRDLAVYYPLIRLVTSCKRRLHILSQKVLLFFIVLYPLLAFDHF